MSEQPSEHLGGLDVELARRIDAVCRRFEAEWRAGRRASVEDYLDDVPAEGRTPLRAELEALERELRQVDETVARVPQAPPGDSSRASGRRARHGFRRADRAVAAK